MAKFHFVLALVVAAAIAVSAQPIEEPEDAGSVPIAGDLDIATLGWSCGSGGDFACGISCGLHGRFKGGHCNKNEVCICN